MKIVICTGGCDPIHKGHIEYFKAAKKLGDMLIVGLNSDEWLTRKRGNFFMNWENRASIIRELQVVDTVIDFDDSDDSARRAIQKVKEQYPLDDIIFVNGGDRTQYNIPEMTEENVEFVFGVGGEDKLNSSSWMLNDWEKWVCRKQLNHTAEPVDRGWGYYTVISEISKNIKVKTLDVAPGKSLSYQKHTYRDEFWIVKTGVATVLLQGELITMQEGDYLNIKRDMWHQIQNLTNTQITVFEVQHGEKCEETDITRI